MPAFVAGAILLYDGGYAEQPAPAVRRTQMDDLMVKQLQTGSRTLKVRPVQYLLPSKAIKNDFETFVNVTLGRGAAWFDWTDPYDEVVKLARIVGGKYDLKPQRKSLDRWVASFSIETWS